MTYIKDNLRQIFQQPFNIQEWQQMLQHYFQTKGPEGRARAHHASIFYPRCSLTLPLL